jgi:hypothetical protein
VPVHELDWLTSVRLSIGPKLSLIDLSASGALFETSARLRPGETAALTIIGRGVEETTSFRILRCEVASLGQGPVYRGACVFDRLIQIPGASSTAATITAPGDATGEADVLAMIRSLARRGQDRDTGVRHGQLFAAIRAAVEQGHSPASLLRRVERELGVSSQAPARARASVSLSTAPPPAPPAPEPAAAATVPNSPTRVPHPAVDAQPNAASGWNKLVVRFLDGTVLKGFSQDFHPTRTQFHLAPSIMGGRDQVSLVFMRTLKAVFFVRDFAGDPGYVVSRSLSDRTPGRHIEVTFVDGEQIVGTTLGYRADGSGFFVRPADIEGNNLRVFVAPGAVRSVRFL